MKPTDIIARTTAVVNRISTRYKTIPDFRYATLPERDEMRAISDSIKMFDPKAHDMAHTLSSAFVSFVRSSGDTPALQIQRLILQLGVSIITDDRVAAIFAYTCIHFDAILDIINESENTKTIA